MRNDPAKERERERAVTVEREKSDMWRRMMDELQVRSESGTLRRREGEREKKRLRLAGKIVSGSSNIGHKFSLYHLV